MKTISLLTAFLFSATAFNGYSQDLSPAANSASLNPTTSTSSSKPDLRTSVRSGNPTQLPIPGRFSTQQRSYVRPDASTRLKRFVNATAGPYAIARQIGGAGIATWRNSPEEWGGQWEGFGKRVASNFGKNAIKQTSIYALDEALKLDSHYYRSTKKDPSSRIKNALISPVTARNSKGKRVIGVPRLVGTYTASITAAEVWFPKRYDWKDGVRSGSISLGFNAAFNLFKEFVWKK